jgi:hypothetical protein
VAELGRAMKPLAFGVLVGVLGAVFFRGRGRAWKILRAARASSKGTAGTASVAVEHENEDAEAPTSESLEQLTRNELYRRAQAAEIPGRSEMSKAELIAALRAR